MSNSEPPASSDDRDRREIRARLTTLARKTKENRYWAAARLLRDRDQPILDAADILGAPDTPTKNPPNRPAVDDRNALIRMAGLVVMGGLTRWKAARQVAEMNPGHSIDSTARRLHRKYRKTRPNNEAMWKAIRRVQRTKEAFASSAGARRSIVQAGTARQKFLELFKKKHLADQRAQEN